MGPIEVGDIRGFQLSRQTRMLYTIRNDKVIVLAFFDVRVKFGNEILNGEYFDLKAKMILFEPQTMLGNEKTDYGLGWYIGVDENGHRIW